MDSLLSSIARIVDRLVGRRLDHLALYPARVVSQRSDGSLDLVPDDPRAPSCQGVPYVSLPGVRLVVPAGTRVLLGYAGGDPSQPRAVMWELGDVTRLVVADGTHPAARQGHAVSASTSMAAWISAVSTFINTDTPGTVTPPTDFGAIAEGADVLRLP